MPEPSHPWFTVVADTNILIALRTGRPCLLRVLEIEQAHKFRRSMQRGASSAAPQAGTKKPDAIPKHQACRQDAE